VQKGEVTVIGKCGFIGFAELRVSMLCNLDILWPERYRVCPARAQTVGQLPAVSAAGFSWSFLSWQSSETQKTSRILHLSESGSRVFLQQNISISPWAFHRHTERGRIYPAYKYVRSDCVH